MEDIRKRRRERKSLIYSTNRWQTVCETQRLIYDEIHEMPDSEWKERIINYLVDSIIIGKKMQSRLSYYKETYEDFSGSSGGNIRRLKDNGKRDKMRKARKHEKV